MAKGSGGGRKVRTAAASRGGFSGTGPLSNRIARNKNAAAAFNKELNKSLTKNSSTKSVIQAAGRADKAYAQAKNSNAVGNKLSRAYYKYGWKVTSRVAREGAANRAYRVALNTMPRGNVTAAQERAVYNRANAARSKVMKTSLREFIPPEAKRRGA